MTTLAFRGLQWLGIPFTFDLLFAFQFLFVPPQTVRYAYSVPLGNVRIGKSPFPNDSTFSISPVVMCWGDPPGGVNVSARKFRVILKTPKPGDPNVSQ